MNETNQQPKGEGQWQRNRAVPQCGGNILDNAHFIINRVNCWTLHFSISHLTIIQTENSSLLHQKENCWEIHGVILWVCWWWRSWRLFCLFFSACCFGPETLRYCHQQLTIYKKWPAARDDVWKHLCSRIMLQVVQIRLLWWDRIKWVLWNSKAWNILNPIYLNGP